MKRKTIKQMKKNNKTFSLSLKSISLIKELAFFSKNEDQSAIVDRLIKEEYDKVRPRFEHEYSEKDDRHL